MYLVAKEIDREAPARRRTIPLWGSEFDWWTAAVQRRIAELGIDQKFLSEYIDAEPPEVSRCINRRKPIYELLIAISDALDIPYPVVLPETEEEALEIARQRRLVRRDAQMAQIKAGVAKIKGKGQIRPLSLADVDKWKSKQGTT